MSLKMFAIKIYVMKFDLVVLFFCVQIKDALGDDSEYAQKYVIFMFYHKSLEKIHSTMKKKKIMYSQKSQRIRCLYVSN